MKKKIVSIDLITSKWNSLLSELDEYVEKFVEQCKDKTALINNEQNEPDYSAQSVAQALIYRHFISHGEFDLTDGRSAKIVGVNGNQVTILVKGTIDEI